MNIKRNVLTTIVAGTLLATAGAASAGGLGGGLGGALGGTLGGGGGGLAGAGSFGGGGRFDDAGTFGSVRDRAGQVGGRTRDVAGDAAAAGHSRVEKAQAAKSAVTQDAPKAQAQAHPDGVLLEGNGAGGIDKQVMGRNVGAQGAGHSSTRADRSGLATDSDGDASFAVKKPEPAAAPAEATSPSK